MLQEGTQSQTNGQNPRKKRNPSMNLRRKPSRNPGPSQILRRKQNQSRIPGNPTQKGRRRRRNQEKSKKTLKLANLAKRALILNHYLLSSQIPEKTRQNQNNLLHQSLLHLQNLPHQTHLQSHPRRNRLLLSLPLQTLPHSHYYPFW